MSQIEAFKMLASIQRELQDLRSTQGVIEGLRLLAQKQQEELQKTVQIDEENFQQTAPFPITYSKFIENLDLVSIFLCFFAICGVISIVADYIVKPLKRVFSFSLAVGIFVGIMVFIYFSFLGWIYWKTVSFEHNMIGDRLEEEKENVESWKRAEKTLTDAFDHCEHLHQQLLERQEKLFQLENLKKEDQDRSSILFLLKALEKKAPSFDQETSSLASDPLLKEGKELLTLKQDPLAQIQKEAFDDLLEEQRHSFYYGRERVWSYWTLSFSEKEAPFGFDLMPYLEEKDAIFHQIDQDFQKLIPNLSSQADGIMKKERS